MFRCLFLFSALQTNLKHVFVIVIDRSVQLNSTWPSRTEPPAIKFHSRIIIIDKYLGILFELIHIKIRSR